MAETAAAAALSGAICVADAGLQPSPMSAETGIPMPTNNGRPNILFILADQHRADCLGAYGNPELRSPHLDTLAADGVRFTNAFCSFPVCTPSRYSILSGLHVHEHRGWTNHCTLPPGTDTFPAMLKAAGYRTTAVGKMHFTPTYFDVGFERMMLAEQDGPGRWDDDYHRDLRDAGLVDAVDLEDQRSEYRQKARPEYWEHLGAVVSNLPAEYHTTEWIGRKALDELGEWGPGGNLLMVGFVKPHHPFDPPLEWCDAYDPERTSLLPGWTPECFAHDLALHRGYFPHETLTESAVRRATAYYYATIEHMDLQIGRMIDLLKSKGLYENTLIIYTSDHGEYMGFHHLMLKGNYMYDPLVRVPLIIKYPAGRGRGVVSDVLTSNVDLAPTLLRAAGVSPSRQMHGYDLANSEKTREVVFAESGRGCTMARSGRYKIILDAPNKRSFFYDLQRDPHECVNRYDDPTCGDDRVALESALRGWRDPELKSDVYLDLNAPVISGPNVPPRDNSHRAAIIKYYEEKMAEWAERSA